MPAQSGAVIIAPPIVRYSGNTVLTPDLPLLGRLNLEARRLQRPLLEQPPTLQPERNEAAMSPRPANAGSVASP